MLTHMEETVKEIAQKIRDAKIPEETRTWAECLKALTTAFGIASNLYRASP